MEIYPSKKPTGIFKCILGLERRKERRATGHHWGTGVLFGWKAGSGKLELDLCCCEQ